MSSASRAALSILPGRSAWAAGDVFRAGLHRMPQAVMPLRQIAGRSVHRPVTLRPFPSPSGPSHHPPGLPITLRAFPSPSGRSHQPVDLPIGTAALAAPTC